MRSGKVVAMLKNKMLVALLFTCMTIVMLVEVLGHTKSGNASPQTVWEYKLVEKTSTNSTPGPFDSERGLNEIGLAGWELVQFIPERQGSSTPLNGYWLFKRPK